MFWQRARELHSAHGSHLWGYDVFDTMRHSVQNTPPLQHKVVKGAYSVPCGCQWRQIALVCLSLRMSGLICRIRNDRTKQELCKTSPHLATEQTIDLKLHKHGCKADTCHLLLKTKSCSTGQIHNWSLSVNAVILRWAEYNIYVVINTLKELENSILILL